VAINTTIPRTRRALLGAGLGAVAATVVGAVGRPLQVAAAGDDDSPVVVGGSYPDARTLTYLAISANDSDVLVVGSNPDLGHGGGTALRASSDSGNAVYATSYSGRGVFGSSVSATGVNGASTSGTGVQGISESGRGVYGQSGDLAIYGYNTGVGTAVLGYGQHGEGVRGHTTGSAKAAIVGHAYGSTTGVAGLSGGGNDPTLPTKTGVFGYSADGGGRGGQFAG
jgi:hypothetical protein